MVTLKDLCLFARPLNASVTLSKALDEHRLERLTRQGRALIVRRVLQGVDGERHGGGDARPDNSSSSIGIRST
jgi:hypothetical protein